MEFRFPPAIESVKDFVFRWELIATTLQLTLVDGIDDFETLLKNLMPVLQGYYSVELPQKLELMPHFHTALSLSRRQLADDCPQEVERYFETYISNERRQRVLEEQREAARIERLAVSQAIETALRSSRRKARTLRLGDKFSVSFVHPNGTRRSRVITVTPKGLCWERSRVLLVKPIDAKVTVETHCGLTITWAEYRRAGETLHYTPEARGTRGPIRLRLEHWGHLRAVENSTTIVRSYYYYGGVYIVPQPGDEIYSLTRPWRAEGNRPWVYRDYTQRDGDREFTESTISDEESQELRDVRTLQIEELCA